MEAKNYDTASEAINDLIKIGYDIDFLIKTEQECIVCHKTQLQLSPDEFEIDQIHRFEGLSDPGDGMIVYAISAIDKDAKGVVVNAYGMYADDKTSAIVAKLNRKIK